MVEVIFKAIDQLRDPISKDLQVLLETIELELYEGKPIHVLQKDSANEPDQTELFFSLKDSRLLLGLSMKKIPPYSLKEFYIQPTNEVYLVATTENLSLDQLKELTGLIPTDGWSLGDKKGSRTRSFTEFEISSPDDMVTPIDIKLNQLCRDLMVSLHGVLELKKHAKCRMVIASFQHISNVHGMILKTETINNLASLQ